MRTKYLSAGVALPFGLILVLTLFLDTPEIAQAAMPGFAGCDFRTRWEYSDKLVSDGPNSGRGYAWGPNSFGALEEPYKEAPNSSRLVQYFDKSRMELASDPLSLDTRFVTNGLLTKELISGLVQTGDNSYIARIPSATTIVGDDIPLNPSPTYASFRYVTSLELGQNPRPAAVGQSVTQAINRVGEVIYLAKAPVEVKIGYYDAVFGHNVPDIFRAYQNLQGLVWNGYLYATGKVYTDDPTSNVFGLAISDPYWTKAIVGGGEKEVLVQVFERRVLTYTPSNPPAYQIEMGNIGQHYFQWRYSGVPGPKLDNCVTRPPAALSGQKRPGINCKVQKCIALTFDDGPSQSTIPILDALKAHNALATFFVVGNQVEPHAAIIRRAVLEGHEIGNHTWTHARLPLLSSVQIRAQIQQTQAVIKKVTDITPRVYRPPYGETDNRVRAATGLPEVKWTLDTLDWLHRNPYIVIASVVNGARPGGIILMHDTHPTTAQAVGVILDRLQAQGYICVTISELLNRE